MKPFITIAILGMILVLTQTGFGQPAPTSLDPVDSQLIKAQKLCLTYLEKGNKPDDALKNTLSSTGIQVLDTSGSYVVSIGRRQDGGNILETKDANGKFFVKDMIATAQSLGKEELATIRYTWQNPGDKKRAKACRFFYLTDWKWIVFAISYDDTSRNAD